MHNVLQYFQDRLERQVASRGTPRSPVPIQVPDTDDDLETSGDLGYAEGQSFVIEYQDARGDFSTRRITVWSIGLGVGDVPVLIANCHERNAQRTFRIDRIVSCIGFDGEVHEDVPAFISECFGMNPLLAARRASPEDQARWDEMRTAIRHEAVLLAALSHSDGLMHPNEIDVAVAHCERSAEKRGHYITEATLRSLVAYCRRLHPNRRDIERSLIRLMSDDTQLIVSFLVASVKLIDADGKRHPKEVELINDLAMELTGVRVA
jgi:hypothetical protein